MGETPRPRTKVDKRNLLLSRSQYIAALSDMDLRVLNREVETQKDDERRAFAYAEIRRRLQRRM